MRQQRTTNKRASLGILGNNLHPTMDWQSAAIGTNWVAWYLTQPSSNIVNLQPQLVINGVLPMTTNNGSTVATANTLRETGPGSGVYVLQVDFSDVVATGDAFWLPPNSTQIRDVSGAYMASKTQIYQPGAVIPTDIYVIGGYATGPNTIQVNLTEGLIIPGMLNFDVIYNSTTGQLAHIVTAAGGTLTATFPDAVTVGDMIHVYGGSAYWTNSTGGTVVDQIFELA